jgi:hypothetical protein
MLAGLLGACGPSTTGAPSLAGGPTAALVMTGAQTGFAVWPSGAQWVVLGTTDGWRTVTNRTPVAVPTDGGLVLAADTTQVSVGVLPHGLLTVSPVLQSNDAGASWRPSQLPGALLARPWSLTAPPMSWAILDPGGMVVSKAQGAQVWVPSTSAAQLDPGGGLVLHGVEFAEPTTGFLFGTSTTNGHPVYVTTDRGRSWRAVPLPTAGRGPVTALAPCRSAGMWVVPVLTSEALTLFTSIGPAGPWRAGPALSVPSPPLVACGPNRVWAAVPGEGPDTLVTAAPGQAWSAGQDIGTRLSSLAVASEGVAYGVGTDRDAVVSLRLDPRLEVSELGLPDWVGTIGGAPMRD